MSSWRDLPTRNRHTSKPLLADTVVATCFKDQPERAWLQALAAEGFPISFVESRIALVARVVALRPRVVLAPLRDAHGVTTAPLISRIRHRVPAARALLLIAPGVSSRGVAEAIRAGGEPLPCEGASTLRAALLLAARVPRLSR